MENLEDKILNIKSKADQIRLLHGDRIKFHWPKEFRAKVIKLVDGGVSRRLIAEQASIRPESIDCWISKHRRKQKKLAQEFKEVKIVEPKEIKQLYLVGRQGVEVHGLEFADLLKMFREGLI